MNPRLRRQVSRVSAGAGIAIALVALCAIPLEAQIPDKFTNLKVLPKDISKSDLVATMRGFSLALGVRCSHCHVRVEGNPQHDTDFASDDKPEKRTARVMVEMTRLINEQELPKIATDHPDSVQVSCRTCHHGQARPRLIEDVLSAAYRAGGVDSLIAKYEELRAKHYGTDTYNFGERMLPMLAEKLVGQEDPQAIVRFAEFNLRWFPDSGSTYLMRGQARAKVGPKEEAIADLKKAMELDPELKENAQRALDRLEEK